ncbi:MAG: ATP-binding cassette domain-containing protein [Actinomycetia bacterium]|nr:ATP-binding cassette domain-containing protein [Actinomycetes bacterium]
MDNTTKKQQARTVVAAESLTKRYGSHTAVDSLSFEVPAGQVVGLLGPNGAGKTTAMKMLLGLVRPTSGRASLLGTDLAAPDFAHALQRVGALIEAPALYERLSARQNLELQARVLGVPADDCRIDELLELVDLADRSRDRAGSYSLGMKQRLGIAVGMIGSPELVILDEPANGLDPAGIVENRHLLRRLPSMGTTVLVSSHQLSEVQQACDSLVVLDRGQLIAAGTTDEILNRHSSPLLTVVLAPASVDGATRRLVDAGLSLDSSDAETLTVTLPAGWTGREVNETLAATGIYATEIRAHRVSLEDAFLSMTAPLATPTPREVETPTNQLVTATSR